MNYPAPTKRDLDSAVLLVNGLTDKQKDDLLREARAICSFELRERLDVLNPYLTGFLLGYMARGNK